MTRKNQVLPPPPLQTLPLHQVALHHHEGAEVVPVAAEDLVVRQDQAGGEAAVEAGRVASGEEEALVGAPPHGTRGVGAGPL